MADKEKYDRHRERAREAQRLQSNLGREIGEVPKCANTRRRSKCRQSLLQFCKTYLSATFPLAFSPDHLKVIDKIEKAVLQGGLFALAMPRGSGKTTLCESAVLWSLIYGHRSFVVLIGADESAALRSLESVKVELETNDLLHEDFPEVCYPIQKLERISHRCRGQTCNAEPTYITWQSDVLTLPTIKGSKASGATVRVAGLTGSIRGLKHKRPDGVSIRPDLVVIDDPQTDESARSASQCAYRERVLSGAVLGLAGPGKKISGIMPCTVIQKGDLADRLLDPALHPQWHGERTKLLYGLPARQDLWEEYARLRADSLRAGRGGADATEFYRTHQAEMDSGCSPAWPERFNPDEITAIQHAMNLRIDGPESFESEYQNEPKSVADENRGQLTTELILGRINRHKRGLVPAGSTRLTAMVDVQGDLLYWLVAAWSDDYTGAVVDYGTYPDQGRSYFTLSDARPTLAHAVGISSLEGAIFAGLDRLANQVLSRGWSVDGGGEMRIERCLVDANWGTLTDTVYRWARQTPYSALVTPSHGKAIGASGSPMGDWQRIEGERKGLNWCLRLSKGRAGRYVIYDTNFWKSFVAARFFQPLGERGALSIFGESAAPHRLFADHCVAEFKVRTSGRGREVDEWKIRPERPDNHWFDCLVGTAVAASIQGVQLGGVGLPSGSREQTGKKRVSWAEMQRKARGHR